jgi:hypothetical protein
MNLNTWIQFRWLFRLRFEKLGPIAARETRANLLKSTIMTDFRRLRNKGIPLTIERRGNAKMVDVLKSQHADWVKEKKQSSRSRWSGCR